jgi:hypothetical protein
LGVQNTISLLSPLLQQPGKKLHASYIAIFINAVKEAVKWGGSEEKVPGTITLTKYLPIKNLLSLMDNNADALRIWDARDLALNVNKFLKQ